MNETFEANNVAINQRFVNEIDSLCNDRLKSVQLADCLAKIEAEMFFNTQFFRDF